MAQSLAKLVIELEANFAKFNSSFDQLQSNSGSPQVQAIAVVNGQQQCASSYNIWVIANPIEKAGMQDAPYSTIFWDKAASLYRFKIAVPRVAGILPFLYNLPRLPLVGVLSNRLNLALQTEGTIAQDGTTYVRTLNAIADVYVLNNSIVSPNEPLEAFEGDRTFGIASWNSETFDLGLTDVKLFEAEIPQVEIPIISFFGLIDVTVVGAGKDSVGLELRGQIQPMQPRVAAVIAPYRDHKSFSVFEWHGEVFDLPADCVPLAGSDIAPLQAFRFGPRAYGLLFHLEIETEGIEALCRECPSDLDRAKMTAWKVSIGFLPHMWLSHQIADRLLNHLLAPGR